MNAVRWCCRLVVDLIESFIRASERPSMEEATERYRFSHRNVAKADLASWVFMAAQYVDEAGGDIDLAITRFLEEVRNTRASIGDREFQRIYRTLRAWQAEAYEAANGAGELTSV
jgi:hypothetical protein